MSSSSSYAPTDDSQVESGSELEYDEQSPGRERRSSSRQRTLPKFLDGGQTEKANEKFDVDKGDIAQQAYNEHIRTLPPKALEGYTALLKQMENEITFTAATENDEGNNVSQHGAVIWTATEKDIFYNILDRRGKNGIKEIAAAIATKSELEVMEYLRILHKGLEKHHTHERHVKTITIGDVPAAAEVSQDCCAELDKYAATLTMQESALAGPALRRRYNDYWIIDEAQAKSLSDLETDVPMPGGINLAANLLNTPMWIQLSRRLFMNFGGSRIDDNWVHIIKSKDESPSMTGDAYMNFYALVVSITRRLVHSSLFFAMCRLRSSRRVGADRQGAVRKQDVKAAISTLGMQNTRPNLAKLTACHDLSIIDVRKRKGWVARKFTSDEAALILDGEDDYFEQTRDSRLTTESSGDEDSDEDSDGDNDGDSHEESSDGEANYRSPSRRRSPSQDFELSSPLSSPDEGPLDPEEGYAENVDQENSRSEELKLWRMLQQPAPLSLGEPLSSEEDDKEKNKELAAQKPFGERRTKQELVDWRDRTLHRSEWEEYGYDITELEEGLVQNRHKRRRIDDEPQPLSASVVNSDDSSPEGPQLGAEENTRVDLPAYGSEAWQAFIHSLTINHSTENAE
ncbi:hypothetical protein N7462_004011 [Penicillium macrosclerotiorum]|uniref:uncharacterized protein n=1 Tax=Penicillium macrosclerotiorum TaxID=303699 RepID=UPI00254877B1|nr:uncharacterized protein N7462_004011 [Penicillium macrosclerotiorum]KAJ5689619.1 hypothetical protein N7462_004011 [Penicillium macrosclerotiorum]